MIEPRCIFPSSKEHKKEVNTKIKILIILIERLRINPRLSLNLNTLALKFAP